MFGLRMFDKLKSNKAKNQKTTQMVYVDKIKRFKGFSGDFSSKFFIQFQQTNVILISIIMLCKIWINLNFDLEQRT